MANHSKFRLLLYAVLYPYKSNALQFLPEKAEYLGIKKNENSHSAILKFWHTLRYQEYNWIR